MSDIAIPKHNSDISFPLLKHINRGFIPANVTGNSSSLATRGCQQLIESIIRTFES
jgi:hypothetical protein